MNEPAIRTEEQIISLFPDRETQICRGWMLKRKHTNYHLSSILTDNGYRLEKCGVVGEWNLTAGAGKMSMKEKMQGVLFLKNGNLPDPGIEDILRFFVENGIARILADIPGKEELSEQYGQMGFRRAYLYRCYQKNQEEKSSKEQED